MPFLRAGLSGVEVTLFTDFVTACLRIFLCFHTIYIYIYIYIYILTPWCRVLLEKLTGLQLVKKFPAFHATRRFITALTSVRHLSLYPVPAQTSPYTHIPPPGIHPNIIHPSIPRSPQWAPSLRFLCVYIYMHMHARLLSHQPRRSRCRIVLGL